MAPREKPTRPVRVPRRARLYKEGIWVLPGNYGQALVGMVTACDNPECGSPVVYAALYPVDGRCQGVQIRPGSLAFFCEPEGFDDPVDARAALAVSIDYETGAVLLDEEHTAKLVGEAADETAEHEPAADASYCTVPRVPGSGCSHTPRDRARGEQALGDLKRMYLSWIESALNGHALDALAAYSRRVKVGIPFRETRLSTFDPSAFEPGALVAYHDVFATARRDAYLVDGDRYEAHDLYCINPDCDCQESWLAIVGPAGRDVGAIRVPFDGPVDYHVGRNRELPARIWRLFSQRHLTPDRLRRRYNRIKKVARDRAHELAPRAPETPLVAPGIQAEPIVRAPRVGRNDPCPCGSGRKYKKCCMRLSG